jgi:hypothetical protein
MLVTVAQTIPVPPIHVDSDDLVMRGWYSQRFLDSDGVTPVMAGNGESGFYYEIACNRDVNSNLVIPEFSIHTTDDGVDVNTSLFTGKLWIDGADSGIVLFGFASGAGWIIASSLGSPTTWDQLDVFNAGQVQFPFGIATTLSASAIVALIQSIPKGDSGYSGYSGPSGYSGFTGISGFSGYSGFTGTSGYSGYSGKSGYSGYSGRTGVSGFSGYSGISGYSGFSSVSGYSGFSGPSGYSGFSGKSGYSGYTGVSGYSGFSGV